MLFVFAHQDDETAALSRIVFELGRGSAVHCIFLTDGGAPAIRNAESLSVLTRLGVDPHHVLFGDIPDGSLVLHLDRALQRVETAMTGADVGTIYCLAYEGGHQDHDASQLVAAAFARRIGKLDRCFEMPLYRGGGGPLFRVLSPLPNEKWESRRFTFREGLRLAMLPWLYRSQLGSWLGLFPEAFVKIALLRRELIRAVDVSRYKARPHSGKLFYEGRFRFPYERFASASKEFIRKHFP